MKMRWMWIPVCVIGFIVLAGLVVMALWNWLMPAIFGLGVITYWQALGILVLAKLLFGGFRGKGWGGGKCCGHSGGGGGYYWKHKFKNRWQNMSPEEKAKWEESVGDSGWCNWEKKKAEGEAQ